MASYPNVNSDSQLMVPFWMRKKAPESVLKLPKPLSMAPEMAPVDDTSRERHVARVDGIIAGAGPEVTIPEIVRSGKPVRYEHLVGSSLMRVGEGDIAIVEHGVRIENLAHSLKAAELSNWAPPGGVLCGQALESQMPFPIQNHRPIKPRSHT